MWTQTWHFGFDKRRGIYRSHEQLLALRKRTLFLHLLTKSIQLSQRRATRWWLVSKLWEFKKRVYEVVLWESLVCTVHPCLRLVCCEHVIRLLLCFRLQSDGIGKDSAGWTKEKIGQANRKRDYCTESSDIVTVLYHCLARKQILVIQRYLKLLDKCTRKH